MGSEDGIKLVGVLKGVDKGEGSCSRIETVGKGGCGVVSEKL